MTHHLYVLPISGGYFPHQLAMLEWMAEATEERPSVVLASSGGNVAAYLAMASQWKKDRMRELYTQMKANEIWQSWWPDYLPLPTILKGYFRGSMYRIHPKFRRIYDGWFTSPEQAMETEIWTGTFNKTRGMSHIFCNQAQSVAQLQPLNISQAVYMNRNLNCQDVTYLAGDLDMIYTVSLASAAVPAIFPSQKIDTEDHNDGGSSFSSPLTPMQDVVRQHLRSKESYHITYFSSYNILMSSESVCHMPSEMRWDTSIYHQGRQAMYELLKSLNIQDRKCAIELICQGKSPVDCQYEDSIVTAADFPALHARRMGYTRSLLELYPLVDKSVPLVSFTPQDLMDVIDGDTSFGCRLWYYITPTQPEPSHVDE